MLTRFHGVENGRAVVERVQDVEAILERNKALQGERQNTETFHHVGTIPNVILERWLNEEHARGNIDLRLFTQEFDGLVFRKLRDPEWQWLRTTRKRF